MLVIYKVLYVSCFNVNPNILWAGTNSLADLVRVEVVVHQLVDDVVRVLVYKLQAHRLQVRSNIVTNLGQPVSNVLMEKILSNFLSNFIPVHW